MHWVVEVAVVLVTASVSDLHHIASPSEALVCVRGSRERGARSGTLLDTARTEIKQLDSAEVQYRYRINIHIITTYDI